MVIMPPTLMKQITWEKAVKIAVSKMLPVKPILDN